MTTASRRNPTVLRRRRLLDELRACYEATGVSAPPPNQVPDCGRIDERVRRCFRWLEQAVTYLNGLQPPIDHRFDLGHGFVFDSPRFGHGSVVQREQRLRGFPVLREVAVYYEIAAASPLVIDFPSGWLSFAEHTLDTFGLKYTARTVENSDDKWLFSVSPVIPAKIAFEPHYDTGLIVVTLVNVDRLERVSLEFGGTDIDEPALEDLVRLMLGDDSAFLQRAPLAGMPRVGPGVVDRGAAARRRA